MQTLGSCRVDFHCHETEVGELTYGLNIPLVELENQELIIVIGSHVNHAHPLVAHRIRKAFLKGAKIICINPVDFDFAFDCYQKHILSPEKILALLSKEELLSTEFSACENKTILLGELALCDQRAPQFKYHIKRLARKYNANVGFLPEGANNVGCAQVSTLFENMMSNRHAVTSLGAKLPGYVLFNIEPEFDLGNPLEASEALMQAKTVIAFSAYRSKSLLDCATVILPIALFAENAGSMMNIEGRLQQFEAIVPCVGEAKPAWKILRVLGDFSYQSIQEVWDEIHVQLKHKTFRDVGPEVAPKLNLSKNPLQIIKTWPIYRTDALVRRSESLQNSPTVETPCLKCNEATYKKYQLSTQKFPLEIKIDACIADDCILVPYGVEETLHVEKLLT